MSHSPRHSPPLLPLSRPARHRDPSPPPRQVAGAVLHSFSFPPRCLFIFLRHVNSRGEVEWKKKWSSEAAAAAARHLGNKSACCLPARRHFLLNSRRLACFNDFQSQFVVVVGATPHTPVVSTACSACSTCSSLGPACGVNLRDNVLKSSYVGTLIGNLMNYYPASRLLHSPFAGRLAALAVGLKTFNV